MIAELGLFALCLALFVAALQAVVPLLGAARGEASWMKLAGPAALAQFVLVSLAFMALLWLHAVSDFSVLNVVRNSHTDKPLLYKLAGAWGNHEGSMLLWAFVLALYGAAAALLGKRLPAALRARALSVQGMIAFGFLLFLIAASDPFERLDPAPVNGLGLNPLLQDPALAFHPPFLYLGTVGFSIVFSFAVAALVEGRADREWARLIRPWTLFAWAALTIGIALGAWWSYYTLGWGGWWAWDPVENASLMPWLTGTALLHSVLVAEKRGSLKAWTIFLAIATFSLSLLGTFLVRSGVLTSVHAFAEDPGRGVFILVLLALITGGALLLFALRAPALKADGVFAPVSREGGIVFNNVFLTAAAGTVLLGTLYPLAADALHLGKLSVGPPYFDTVMPPLFIPLLLLMGAGPLLAWKRGDLKEALRRLIWAALLAAAALLATLNLAGLSARDLWAALGLGLAAWLIAGTLTRWAGHTGLFRLSFREVLNRARQLPRQVYGMVLAHLGTAVVLIGIAGSLAWQSEKLLVMRPGDTAPIAGYGVRLIGVDENLRGPNYTAERATFIAARGGGYTVLQPERRLYDNPPQEKSEVAIHTDFVGDLYLVLGEGDGKGGFGVHLFHNPLVPWLFAGLFLMALGGAVSLSGGRRETDSEEVPSTPKKLPQGAKHALPVLAFLALAILLFWRLEEANRGETPDLVPSVLIGKPAPRFDLPPLTPGTAGFKSDDLKGRVTLVNFFASWCLPCRAEAPLLQSLAKSGIALVGIAYKDKPENAAAFLNETGNPYGVAALDLSGRTAIDFGVYGVPETYLIGKDGVIRFKLAGPLTDRVLREQILPLAERLK